MFKNIGKFHRSDLQFHLPVKCWGIQHCNHHLYGTMSKYFTQNKDY